MIILIPEKRSTGNNSYQLAIGNVLFLAIQLPEIFICQSEVNMIDVCSVIRRNSILRPNMHFILDPIPL